MSSAQNMPTTAEAACRSNNITRQRMREVPLTLGHFVTAEWRSASLPDRQRFS
ncbi:hypothetical protein AB0N33_07590 [Pseudarthrobacter oxydans]|uniref:hypothetical protein n=1 Tax=Pseudarthrobacter oxydans TaxID=1671 RepID=UPI003442A78E